MMHGKRGCMAVMLGLTMSLAGGCDGEDSDADDISERDDNDEGDVAATGEQACERIIDAGECLDKPGCAPVFGKQLFEDAIGWCTDSNDQFIICRSTIETCSELDPGDCAEVCPGIAQTICVGEGVFQVEGCAPADSQCTAPGTLTGECDETVHL
jgi:hypothetical protein